MSPFHVSPRIVFRSLVIALMLIGLLSLFTPAAAADERLPSSETDIRLFELVTPGSGWVLMGQHLYWSDNHGETWQDITPPGSSAIMDVTFLDDQNGWVILSQNDPSRFSVVSTTNRGETWDQVVYDFSGLSQMPSAVSNVYMGWRNVSEGWLVFKVATGSNFSVGLLYTTQDGGKSWQMHDIPLGEPAFFIDSQNGWIAAGPGGRIYRTYDGGNSWQEEMLEPNAYHHLPLFMDDVNGILPVITADGSAAVEFLQTNDTGRTWTSAGRIPLEVDTPFDLSLPLAAAEASSTLLIPNSDRILQFSDGQLLEFQNTDGQSANIVELTMINAQIGWGRWMVGDCESVGKLQEGLACTRETKLLSTDDGGRTWSAILLPGIGQASIQESFSSSGKANTAPTSSALAISDPDTQSYVGQGFDKCEVPTLTQMQKWWTSSPYNAVNLYIGGSARACANSALNSSFVSQLNAQGWRFIPTWVGPQASCSGYGSRMSADATVAYQQGVAEADLALNTAVNLGLSEPDGSGTIIYYDLEAYNTANTTCRNAANAFVSGWVGQMKARGNLGGVYGASCASAVSDWASITNVPDAVWIANWYGNAGEVSYRPTASVWGNYCLSDALWANHQRLRQYAGDHNESWGGITLGIDSNALDGPLTMSNDSGGVLSPSQAINQGPAQNSILERTNDTWLTWKTTGDTCSVHIWGGSLDMTISGSCSNYRLGVRPGGLYSWQVIATNTVGSTVGPVWQFKIKPYAASNLSVSSASATTLNLNWQLSADDPTNVDGYTVYRDGAQIASVGKSVANYQVTNLACNTSYSFQVRTVRQGVESDASNSASGTTTTCAPVLVHPADALVLENRRPSFEWQSVNVATAYQIQVSTYSNFSSLVVNTKVTGLNYSRTSDLAVNKTYYWRVRGVGPFGNGDWSETRSFTTANPPSLPKISTPTNGSVTTDRTPTLNWTDSIPPIGTFLQHYQVQLSSDTTFTTTLYDELITLSEFTLPVELTPNLKYYWRVRAFNTLGQYSSWTAAWSFRTSVLPPLSSQPMDDTVLVHTRPAFEWSDVETATKYTLQLSKYPNFSPVLMSKSSNVSHFTFTSDLPRNTLLYWRVRAEAVNGPSMWSDVQKFTTGNPPPIPSRLSPAANLLNTNYQPKLDWIDVVPPSGTTLDHYQIQLATDFAFVSIVSDTNVSLSQYIPATPLDANMKYYWRVRAFNTLGHYSAWSAINYFRTAMLPPVLVTPEFDSLQTSSQPDFGWQAVTGASSYTIQISLYSNFSGNLVNTKVPGSVYIPSAILPRGVTLYWRVRANGPNGPSLWSSIYQFKIE